MEEFKIDNRKVEVVRYSLGGISPEGIDKLDGLKIDVLLNDDDCPQGKCLEERICCKGDCQNTYFTIFLKKGIMDTDQMGGTVHGWERLCTCDYAQEIGLTTIESLYGYLKEREFEVREKRGIQEYVVDGRVLLKSVSKDHCSFSFPLKEEDGIKRYLLEEKREAMDQIKAHLEELKTLARPANKEKA